MLRLEPPDAPHRWRVLCLGAHADDIEIGCGGTILRLIEEVPDLEIRWVVFSGDTRRREEAQAGFERFTAGAPSAVFTTFEFRDGYYPAQFATIKDAFETLKDEAPTFVFTHHRHDRHQDHRVISDLAWNTFRYSTVLEYEIPKWDGDVGQPNLYVPLAPELCRRKIEHLTAAFRSQGSKRWFSEDTFMAMLRLRGIESGATEGYAEAFHGFKLVALPMGSAADGRSARG